ncbi:hypothetical protein LGV61_03640 [Desulfurispirillum indicum]|uniref:Uncharacterized protein n=1 Tax=Desulfurispirillum indicum (strain ATCC BAA-1389 / DSM 22839 / S5) TaxID=653733 RepID=E6W1T1_DESIS|nr:hypothetical protein [Desulfurispirillum indicum]ADU65463.1 hypothetical protein Selin_0719 [Desulfurispirillum indicum S5]UCZ57383.1 hypothetical protein LGV61_03640 [Desulfurispirillum indicum]
MDTLDQLIALARNASIEVRTEKLRGNTSGGFCRIGGEPVIFLNRSHKRVMRAQVLRRALDDAADHGIAVQQAVDVQGAGSGK